MTLENISVSRRKFVAGLTAIMGTSFVANYAGAIDAAVAYQSGARAKFFTTKQLEMVKLIGEIIIPQTNTAGAIAADVHGYIDYMVADFMTTKAQKKFLSGLEQLDAKADGFLKLSATAQQDFIAELDKKAYAKKVDKKKYEFYRSLKGWVTTGYFTSKAGMTEARAYTPLPGPLREVTRQEWLAFNGWA